MGICVLLTSVGGLVSPGIIENLRNIPEVSRIIGTDVLAEAIGFYMVDKRYVVPRGDASEYYMVLSEIVGREAVDVIIPCSDEEVLALSLHKDALKEMGVAVLCSTYEITATAIDKGNMLSFLQQRGVPVPQFYLPTRASELVEAAEELGYPARPVVVKPRRGRGGRGFKILRDDVNVLQSRDSHELKLQWFVDAIEHDGFGEIVLMEYLPGDDYSVDVLADHGHSLCFVPRKRIKAILGPSQLGEIALNQEVLNIVRSIVKLFGFDSNANIQLRYPARPSQGPMVYEINPRVSGTIVASTAGGIDLLYFGIRHALGLDFPGGVELRPVRMIRYLKEHFVPLR